MSATGKHKSANNTKNMKAHSASMTPHDTVRDIVNHPAFEGFGPLLLPWDNNARYYDTPLHNVGSLLPYHGNVEPKAVVDAINHMIAQVNDGKTIFFDFYTERQKQEDPAKGPTGLFFFRGQPGAPFALICPGGGFAYVGSLHEGFPLAAALSKKGRNAFVLRYRTGSELKATADLAAALAYIFKNANMLAVGVDNYSLWGGSAGARMVGNIALKGAASFGGRDLPKPGVLVIAYTGQATYSEGFPPTFITVSEDDGIVNVSAVDRRVENLRGAGVKVEYRKYKNAGHGFGLGLGTDAAGWLEHALRFWADHDK